MLFFYKFLQVERESKYAMKKDLEAKMKNDSLFNISNLAYNALKLPGKEFIDKK